MDVSSYIPWIAYTAFQKSRLVAASTSGWLRHPDPSPGNWEGLPMGKAHKVKQSFDFVEGFCFSSSGDCLRMCRNLRTYDLRRPHKVKKHCLLIDCAVVRGALRGTC